MLIRERIQALVHATEVGGVSRWLRLILLAMAVLGLVVLYDLMAYRNFAAPEAMDAAQVARNLAEGRGYSTEFIRPFSLYLVRKHNQSAHPEQMLTTNATDFARINQPHPDLANPPVYPTLLAAMMKVWKPDWKTQSRRPFWTEGSRFARYAPEFGIALFNQLLLVVVVGLTYLVARKLFDRPAALLTAGLTLGSDLLWKFSVSGLSTMLLLVIFLGLVWCLMQAEELGRVETPDTRRLFVFAILAGGLTGLGMLTRYSFGWLIVPVALFLTLFGGPRRAGLAVAAFLAFAFVVSPWIVRNLVVSGTLFGTAGFAVVEGTFTFPSARLMQSLNPDMSAAFWVTPYTRKLIENSRLLFQNDLLRLGGGWVGVLFFAGLLLGLRNQAARRLRYFTMMCLGVLFVAQALGRTPLSTLTPELNSENLLVLLTPLVVIFGVAFFLTLLAQMQTPSFEIRYAVVVLLVVITCQPFIAALWPPKISPLVYPPYYPPEIQKLSSWMRPDELMMSDIPWAVAWYGDRQCAWLTLDARDQFQDLHKNLKPVRALYLTPLTTDGKFISEWMRGGERSWGNFLYKAFKDLRLPEDFPLTKMPEGFFSDRIFLSNLDRWSAPK